MTRFLDSGSASVAIWSERLRASLFNRPAHVFESSVNDGARESEDVFPVADCPRFPLERYRHGVPPVESLLTARRPSAIVRAIALVIFNSVKAVLAGWSWSHVSNEFFESHPPLAYRDSAASVVLPGVMRWRAASFQHAAPGGVFLGRRLVVSNRGVTSTIAVLLAETPATPGVTSQYVGTNDKSSTSACARAFISDGVALTEDAHRYDSQATKDSSCQIFNWLTSCGYSALSHAVSSFTGDDLVRSRWSLPTIIGFAHFTLKYAGLSL